jgi:hypothetical protein
MDVLMIMPSLQDERYRIYLGVNPDQVLDGLIICKLIVNVRETKNIKFLKRFPD